MTVDDIRDQMQALSDQVLDAEMAVRNGKMVNLSAMDKIITDLCNRAVKLPPAEASELQPYMSELIGNLDRLSQELEIYKENLKAPR